MRIKLYYDDCRHYSDDDYPCKNLTVDDEEEFDSILFDDCPYIICDDEDGYQVLLMKDRIVEVWIGDDE